MSKKLFDSANKRHEPKHASYQIHTDTYSSSSSSSEMMIVLDAKCAFGFGTVASKELDDTFDPEDIDLQSYKFKICYGVKFPYNG